MLNNYKNNSIQNYLRNLTASEKSDYSLWKATKKIKRPQLHNPPIRTHDGKWIKSNLEKAKSFANHLERVFQPHLIEHIDDPHTNISELLESPYQLELPLKYLKLSQISLAISQLNPKKSPGYDLITAKILSELPSKALTLLTYVFNSIIRTGHFPIQWKTAEIILIQKPGKPPEEIASYRPISLLPLMSKLFESLLKNRLEPILEELQIIPAFQFGFRRQHSTIEQIHRIVKRISQDLEEKKYCSAMFLDINQAFDRVWHQGLMYKLRKILPVNYFCILKSYLQDRHYRVKYLNEFSPFHPINAGVPQGSVLGPLLYLLYTSDLPTTGNATVAIFADDTAILTSHADENMASHQLQLYLFQIQSWLNKWRIKVNESKSVHVTFTNRRNTCPPVRLNNIQIPQREEVKYLGIHLDRRMTWKKHIFTKRKQLGLMLHKHYWLIGPKSELSLTNKLLIYKVIFKPVWTYGLELWGSASNSNLEILERFQAKMLRIITQGPWFVPNSLIARDLKVPTVKEEIKHQYMKYSTRLQAHPNPIVTDLTQLVPHRRLKRHYPGDSLYRF